MPEVRTDFDRPAWLAPEDFEWINSPETGVDRLMLDRHGDELAVATSLVRYGAGRTFPAHSHPRGEEYLVLEGEFADDHGRYPAGTYVRNPPGSRHEPYSDSGCVIWVKLCQFHPDDQRTVVVDEHPAWPVDGVATRELHSFDGEVVTSVALTAGSLFRHPAEDLVQEVLVIEGKINWRDRVLGRHGWFRVPAGEGVELTALESTRLLHKTRPGYAVPQPAGQAQCA